MPLLLFGLQRDFKETGSDGNVCAALKQILPHEPPEQLFTSDKILHAATLAHFLHLKEQDLCVHLDAREHSRKEE